VLRAKEFCVMAITSIASKKGVDSSARLKSKPKSSAETKPTKFTDSGKVGERDTVNVSRDSKRSRNGNSSNLKTLTAALRANFGGDSHTSNGESKDDRALSKDPRGEYEVPKEEDGHNHRTDESNRTSKLAAEQEAAINRAVESGKPVEFTNSNGEKEKLTVQNSEDGDTYVVRGEDGHEFEVSFEGDFSEKDRTDGLARIGDYYTQIPDHLRDANDKIEVHEDGKPDKPNTMADYKDQRIRFYNGLDHLDESTFDHEFGHAIGYKVEDETQTIGDRIPIFGGDDNGRPNDYDDTIESDGNQVSGYSETNQKEDFAESWSAYMEALERGPEAVEEFKNEYPHRTEILEKVYQDRYR
jgi:hypothetical protein